MKRVKQKIIHIAVMSGDTIISSLDLPFKKKTVTIGNLKSCDLYVPYYESIPEKMALLTINPNGAKLKLKSQFEGRFSSNHEFLEIRTFLFPKLKTDIATEQLPKTQMDATLTVGDQAFFTYQKLTILIRLIQKTVDIYNTDKSPIVWLERILGKIILHDPYAWVTFLSIFLGIIFSISIYLSIWQKPFSAINKLSQTSILTNANIIHPSHYAPLPEAVKEKLDRHNYNKTILEYTNGIMKNEFDLSLSTSEKSKKFRDPIRSQIRQRQRNEQFKSIKSLKSKYSNKQLEHLIYFPFSDGPLIEHDYEHAAEYMKRVREVKLRNLISKISSRSMFENQYKSEIDLKEEKVLEAFAFAVGSKRGAVVDLEAERNENINTGIRNMKVTPNQDLKNLIDLNSNLFDQLAQDTISIQPNTPITTIKPATPSINIAKLTKEITRTHIVVKKGKEKLIKVPRKSKADTLLEAMKINNPNYLVKFFLKNKSKLKTCLRKSKRKNINTVVGLIIDQSGKPLEINIEEKSYQNKAMDLCFIKKIASWKFPVGENHPVYVSFAIVFP